MIHDTSGSHGPPRTAPQVLTRQQVRQVDRVAIEEFGMSGLVLMENAGRQVADKLVELEQADPYLIVCGKGNNGGDGFVAARHLELRGYTVHVAIWAEPGEITGDAAANLAILQHAGSQLHWCTVESLSDFGRLLDGAATVVDCLLGTGASGPPRPPLDRVIEQLAGRRCRLWRLICRADSIAIPAMPPVRPSAPRIR
jgi:NAD(P)H-hydrate epimerase